MTDNISKGFRVTERIQFLISKFSKRLKSIKMQVELWSLLSAYFLMMLIFVQKFMEISKRVPE